MFDHTRNTLRERDHLALMAERLGWGESDGYAALQAMLDASDAHTYTLRMIAAAVGLPKDVDPLDDLDGLVTAVRERLAERDRRIDPVEHARAVREAYRAGAGGRGWADVWRTGPERAALLARVGPEALASAEVER